MTSSPLRDQLVATLEEVLLLQRQLVADARDPEVPAGDLVTQVSVLERLDDRRDELIALLRRETSAGRRTDRRGPPLRQVVVDALTEFRWPQNARFLEEYLWATSQLQLDSRALASLRRDEQRSWERAPRARDAYVAPALHEDGSANPRWITNSAWELERRIVVSDRTERLLNLQKILTLAGRRGTRAEIERPRRPSDAVLERYAEQLLSIEPLPPSTTGDDARTWRLRVRKAAEKLIGELRREDDPRREEIAAQLADMPEHDRIWGRQAG
jgi:hypothetical protein